MNRGEHHEELRRPAPGAAGGLLGEPSNSDIESALDKHFTQAQAAGDAAMTAMLGKQAAGSKPQDGLEDQLAQKGGVQGGGRCSGATRMESDIELPMLVLKQRATLVGRASDGWQLVGGFGG